METSMHLTEITKKCLEMDDEEFKLICTSLVLFHKRCMNSNDDDYIEYRIPLEQICQDLNIPGFEFS